MYYILTLFHIQPTLNCQAAPKTNDGLKSMLHGFERLWQMGSPPNHGGVPLRVSLDPQNFPKNGLLPQDYGG